MPLDNGVRFGLADNGMFVDSVARMAKASNDLTVDRDMKGKLDSLAVSLSGEFGWRFPIAANAYVCLLYTSDAADD